MIYQTELTISGLANYYTIFLRNESKKELGRILFTLSNKNLIVIDDLITNEKSRGFGTILTNEFIEYSQKNFSSTTQVIGYVRHDEIFNSRLLVPFAEALRLRQRRNRFWSKFGFKILEEKSYHDNMSVELKDLKKFL